MNGRLSRRHILRGAMGVGLGLPLLEAMGTGQETESDLPVRIVYVYVPNGMNMEKYTPLGAGADYQFSETLQSLEDHRAELSVLSGLSNLPAGRRVSAIDNHGRASGLFLTNTSLDDDLHNVRSVDQIAAEQLGRHTRFPSLHLTCASKPSSGQTQEMYWRTLSWNQDGVPIPAEADPGIVFDRLFSRNSARSHQLWSRRIGRKSLLDYVQEDARQLSRSVSKQDRAKIDEYFDSVRSVEKRITSDEKIPEIPAGRERPESIPEEIEGHFQLMIDLTLLALQVDATRVMTLMLDHEAGQICYRMLGVSTPHHKLSHHQGDQSSLEQIARIDRFHFQQFAKMLDKMKQIREQDSHLLDRSLVLFGSGLSDGNEHSFTGLPLVLAGRAGGSVQQGRHLKLPDDTPLSNLHLTMMQAAGVEIKRFADSTGVLTSLLS